LDDLTYNPGSAVCRKQGLSDCVSTASFVMLGYIYEARIRE
jgi:hypothetical protein